MANFSTIPFTGGVPSTGPRDLTWIPISPTKIALVYTAVFNSATRQVMIQMVTFSGSATPVYSTPCSLGTISNLQGLSFMRGAYLRDSLVVLTIPTSFSGSGAAAVPNGYTYNVVAFDDQNRFNLVSSSANVPAGTQTAWPAHEMTSYNGKAYSIRRDTDASYVFAEIVVDSGNAVTVVTKNTFGMVSTGVQQGTAVARRAGTFWYYQSNAHNSVQTTNSAAFIDLATLTYSTVPATSMVASGAASNLGRCRTATPAGGCILDMAQTTTTFSRFALDGTVVVSSTPYRAAYTGSVADIMWLDDKHFMMLNHSATTIATDRSVAQNAGDLSVQVCRFDQATNSMTVSGAPKLLGTNCPKENYGNMLHKIDESNIAVIGCYQYSSPSVHFGYGVQVISI